MSADTFYAAQCGVLRGALRRIREHLDAGRPDLARREAVAVQHEIDLADQQRNAEIDARAQAASDRFRKTFRAPRAHTGD